VRYDDQWLEKSIESGLKLSLPLWACAKGGAGGLAEAKSDDGSYKPGCCGAPHHQRREALHTGGLTADAQSELVLRVLLHPRGVRFGPISGRIREVAFWHISDMPRRSA
jgi:hypothetical protein